MESEEKENNQYRHIRKDVRRKISFSSDIYYNAYFMSPKCGVADVDLNSNNVTIIDSRSRKTVQMDSKYWIGNGMAVYDNPNDSFYLIRNDLSEYYITKKQEDERKFDEFLTKQVAAAVANKARFQMTIISDYNKFVDRLSSDYSSSIFDHISTFVNYERNHEIDFFATVCIKSSRVEHRPFYPDDPALAYLTLEILTGGSFDDSDHPGSEVEIGFPICQFTTLLDGIRLPEAEINDGGGLNCGGSYCCLFVPRSLYESVTRS
jgi:archaellin